MPDDVGKQSRRGTASMPLLAVTFPIWRFTPLIDITDHALIKGLLSFARLSSRLQALQLHSGSFTYVAT
jgi:hypothetical protein